MANFHYEIKYVSRGQGRSPALVTSYISGKKIRDNYYGKTYDYTQRTDVIYVEKLFSIYAPTEYLDTQKFIDAVDNAEKRSDSRTFREIIASLPNELSLNELIEMVREYITDNFIAHGMCAIVAIHEGKNKDPAKNNPHVHILLTTRLVGQDGFNSKKNREWDKRINCKIWRENWANVQNRAYERNSLDIRVSHESLIMQGKEREAKKYLRRSDYERELRGIRTIRGDVNREIQSRNMEREKKNSRERNNERDRDQERSQ